MGDSSTQPPARAASELSEIVDTTSESLNRRLAVTRLVFLAVLLAAIAAATAVSGARSVSAVVDGIESAGWVGALIFIAIYAVATVLLVPGSATTATAGLIFGPLVGGAVSVIGATIGATASYFIARGLGREPAQALFGERARSLDQWIADRQLRSVLVLRLLPIFPFNALNYALGLSPIRARPFLVGTFFGIMPATLLLSGLGSSLRQPASSTFVVLLAVFVLVSVGSGLLARRLTRRRSEQDTTVVDAQ